MASSKDAVVLTVDGHEVRVSSPEKPYFAELGLRKIDVVEYFIAVGPGVLAALRHRPTTLERWPGGVFEGAKLSTRTDTSGDAFYQKRVPKNAPEWVPTARITFPSGRTADEIAPDSVAVVAWAANLGTLTFHPWPVSTTDVEQPDQIRIDLDPQPGTDFSDAVRVAPHVRELLHEHGMQGWPKTSGGRGLHVYVPIQPRWPFADVRRAVIAFGRELERRLPDRVTMSWWKEERGERIFIDYNQMARDRTIASAYSIRPQPHAPVSAPLDWDELPDVSPFDFTVRTMPDRFRALGDRHAGLADHAHGIESLLELAERQERDLGLGELPYPPDYPKMPGEPMRVQPSRARRPAGEIT
ncbi:ATP-dependent DNA ligase [Modestobacter sp. I12A-02628]|uniref:DNA polymerase domain-containing protein n=1 Tax=Goekera deserti TaxID=2497753 RepID=A0A7K3WDR1_9ACTN|nr:DNA polymerase domain-containing protein [Goekera deserti]MPQ96788.1 ATP-dependent DNA ligase [Goekera deserti]NDI46898.1 ATP-dependent DNA ligase [Goekera deserti]NEL54466.1 DNA polymerase domain-containing protein [Goekera deserti]